jgi:hypothetical protein
MTIIQKPYSTDVGWCHPTQVEALGSAVVTLVVQGQGGRLLFRLPGLLAALSPGHGSLMGACAYHLKVLGKHVLIATEECSDGELRRL